MALQGMHMLLRPYDARFKLHQKLESPVLNERAATAYLPFQELESKQLLFDLLKDPAAGAAAGIDCHGHMERTTASIIYSLFYGHRVRTAQDPILLDAHKVNHEFDQLAQVGKYLADSFPLLNKLPEFFAPWKTEAAGHWQRQRKLHLGNLQRGFDGKGWNFAKQMQRAIDAQGIGMPEVELALDIGIMADAALDASTETTMWFVVACIAADENGWVGKARAELDAAVGRARLPAFADRPALPYISAIVEELLRWRPAGAAGVPHFTKAECAYEGLRIPANSVVIANHWAITREEGVFGPTNVEEFAPERFLGSGELPTVGFGYGRRICPGRHVARNSLWISIARLLWAFDIKPALSEKGEPLIPDTTKCTDGLVSKPLPYKARFEPRGDWARDIIIKECNTYHVDHAAMLDRIGSSMAAK